jgi:hypothetical protein
MMEKNNVYHDVLLFELVVVEIVNSVWKKHDARDLARLIDAQNMYELDWVFELLILIVLDMEYNGESFPDV